MTDIFCEGCGVKIQTENEHEPGYAPPAALDRQPVYCRRCFRLRHYNEIEDVPMKGENFLSLLSQIASVDALIVYLIDIFDVSGSWVDDLTRFIGNNPVLLVGNKEDLLPRSTNPNKLKSWLKRSAKAKGIHPVDVLLISAVKNHGIDEVSSRIDHYRRGRDVYIVGAANVGKSTFINHLIRAASGGKSVITTSHFPGTTLDFIGIPLDDGRVLYDTPGVINPHQAAHFVSSSEYKKIMPNKEIKPRVYQLGENQTLFLGGIGRIDYSGPGKRSLIVYVANALPVHRTKTEHADELYASQFGRMLAPPAGITQTLKFMQCEMKTRDRDTDIVFSGLGWISVKGEGAIISARAPEGIDISMRSSIIKG
ncbi:ribosome biogenesis GTPase YqeH [Sporolactobacillus sp. THM19-2]|uniref:ribosome biogenesis GTPase YqeH n=1 Tax=Sporolactobacillus sp. THM19-2 TaxID=2511171 RepID=UPI0010216164|nr:ribosome biogenesis GTPase YqeH [Sporolactobacillus sp. THM19-2]RYL94754.1 ribosome biogenesis GTPase YqeH [Sporolactobacillus sp. THM19-2]